MYTENKWQKPTGFINTGMSHILCEYIKEHHLPYNDICWLHRVVIHSYKETNTALTVNVEWIPTIGSVKFQQIVIG